MRNRIILLILVASLLAGCNTVNGMGKDVDATGNAISRASGH